MLIKSIAGVAISSADTAPRVADALRKAGVTDSPDTSKRKSPVSKPESPEEQVQTEDKEAIDHMANPDSQNLGASTPVEVLEKIEKTSILTNVASSDASKKDATPLRRKKSVSFAEGTKTEDSNVVRKRLPNPLFAKARGPPAIATADTVYDVQRKAPQEQLTALLNAEANLMRAASDDESDAPITSPVIPEDESPEDAALRRQMLQYNMQEVGAVVAEIDLDDDASTPPYSEDEDEYNYDNSSVEEEEDEYGRSTNVVFGDEYIKQMKDLEKRLNSSTIRNVGPNGDSELLSRSIKESPNTSLADPERNSGTISKNSLSKGVRFATKLDIQEEPITQDQSTQSIVPLETSDDPDPDSSTSAPMKPKISRFKNARKSQVVQNNIVERPLGDASFPSGPKPILTTKENEIPDGSIGPPDRPHADTIIERPFPSHSTAPPTELDEFDPELLQRQLKTEYHRQRNRMVYRQGGFLPTEEDDSAEVPVDEHGHEEGRKMSRFKAARLGR